MALGISTYAFTWRANSSMAKPLTLTSMIENVRDCGATVFQICDYAPLEHLGRTGLRELRAIADANGIKLELGTRGVDTGTMDRFLALAETLGASLVRTMSARFGDHVPTDVIASSLSDAAARFGNAGVSLAVETYESIPTVKLAQIVQDIDNPALGICLDPANSLAALETPLFVTTAAAPWVNSIHIKDFGYGRREGGSGFDVTGRRLGEGQLDYLRMLDSMADHLSSINLIVEHWLPWQGSAEATWQTEADWTDHSMRLLREYAPVSG